MVETHRTDLPDLDEAKFDVASFPTREQMMAEREAFLAVLRDPHHPEGLASSIREFIEALRNHSRPVAEDTRRKITLQIVIVTLGRRKETSDKFVIACERLYKFFNEETSYFFETLNLSIAELTEVLSQITGQAEGPTAPAILKYTPVMRFHEAAKLFGISPRKLPEQLSKMDVRHKVLSRISIRIAEEDLPKTV